MARRLPTGALAAAAAAGALCAAAPVAAAAPVPVGASEAARPHGGPAAVARPARAAPGAVLVALVTYVTLASRGAPAPPGDWHDYAVEAHSLDNAEFVVDDVRVTPE